jgi:type VI protein secretion system component Hcp
MPRRLRALLATSLLAVALVVGGGYVVNAATAPSTAITACSNKKTGALRAVSAKTKCTSKEKRLTWNVKGAAGAQGLPGAPGGTGPAGRDGAPGTNGKDGINGAPGKDGVDGKDGAPGPAGPAGTAGGTTGEDPNPHDLTYRMKIGNDAAVQVAGFTQELSNTGSTHMGSGGGAGKADVGDITVTLPMNYQLLNQMNQLARGSVVPAASLEMCKPGETTGKCSLALALTDVMVNAVQVQQDASEATATVQLTFAREKVSVLPGTNRGADVEFDIRENRVVSATGAAKAISTNDTTYTTTITDGQGGVGNVLSTRSWRQAMTNSSTVHTGTGPEAGKPNFTDAVAETRSGVGTVALFRAVVLGQHLDQVEISGCESARCESKTILENVIVTQLTLGSPTLFDDTHFNFATIKWDRDDSPGSVPARKKSFFWDIAANIG